MSKIKSILSISGIRILFPHDNQYPFQMFNCQTLSLRTRNTFLKGKKTLNLDTDYWRVLQFQSLFGACIKISDLVTSQHDCNFLKYSRSGFFRSPGSSLSMNFAIAKLSYDFSESSIRFTLSISGSLPSSMVNVLERCFNVLFKSASCC